jgi:hypothetical protein
MAGTLSKKIGGIPTWGYLAAGVVVIGGVLYLRKKNAAQAALATSTPASGTQVATTPFGPGGGDGGIGTDTLSAILASQQTSGATTNNFNGPSTNQNTAVGPGGITLDILGSELQQGYTGTTVGGGAPVYALLPGTSNWVQTAGPAGSPAGTLFATPAADSGQIGGSYTNDQSLPAFTHA